MPGGGEPRWHPRPPRPSHSPGGFSGDAGLGDRLLARGPEVLGRLEGGVSAGGGGSGGARAPRTVWWRLRGRSRLPAGAMALANRCLPPGTPGRCFRFGRGQAVGLLLRVDSAFPVGQVKFGHVPRLLLEELCPDLPPAGAI